MTLEELASWHRKAAKDPDGTERDFHLAAANLLRGLIKASATRRANIAAGLAKARAEGKTLCRARIDPAIEAAIRRSLLKGDKGIHRIAAEHGVGTGTVQRIKAELGSEE